MAWFHPDFEKTGDAHDYADLCDEYWIQDVSVDRQPEFVIKHDDTESVPKQYEDVIVHFEFLGDVEGN